MKRLLVLAVAMALVVGCGGGADTGSEPAGGGSQGAGADAPQETPGQGQGQGQGQEPAGAGAEKAPETVEELALYTGPDRESILLEKAKGEGGLLVYTSMTQKDGDALRDAFRSKYGLEATVFRAESEDIVTRVTNEAKGGRHEVDVIDIPGGELEALGREGLLLPFDSPSVANFPENTKPAHRLWYPSRFVFYVWGYNTERFPAGELPKTYEDLIGPGMKGRFSVEEANADWMMTLVKHWGEEKGLAYFEQLGENKGGVRKGYPLLAQLIASGEVPFGMSYNHLILAQQRKGAPVDWIDLEPVVAKPLATAVAKGAPHPYGALLWADFMFGPDGQQVIRDLGRVPANPEVAADPPRLNSGFEYIMMDTTGMLDDYDLWYDRWQKLVIE